MKIDYYYRNSGAGKYSIENVFESVAGAIGPEYQVEKHFASSTFDIRAILSARKNPGDIHHITGAINYVAFGLPYHRTVITVHDIGHYTETLRGWKKLLYKYLFMVFPLRRAKVITAISDFTKEQLIRHFNISPDKIVVIPNPVNPNFKFAPRVKKNEFVILQIGAGINKNIDRLVEAVRALPVKLLLIRPEEKYLKDRLTSWGIAHEFRPDLSEQDLIRAYGEADIVYFASLYEGFGLPILEGMATGRPVITSRLSPMKEIAEDSALLVDPQSSLETREAVKLLIENEQVYLDYQKKGLKRVESFNAKQIAEQYLRIYRSLLTA